MVLDPLSALGLAGNIVQFADFVFKLVTQTRVIYESATGTTKESIVLAALANDIQNLSGALEPCTLLGNGPSASGLQSIAADARNIAQELLDAIESLRARPHSKWASFKAALRHIWNDKKVKELVSQILRLQGMIMNRVIFAMNDQQSEILTKLEEIERKTVELGMNGAEGVTSLRRDILEGIERLDTTSKLEKVTVKELLRRIHKESEANQDDIAELSKRKSNLASYLERLSMEAKVVSYNQAVLESLHFEKMEFRYQAVPEAHSQTFKWIYKKKLPTTGEPLGFLDWLTSKSGIFWVMGKPGSGKSTLMKFICRHKKSMEKLRLWAGKKKLVSADFFFWTGGYELQKSQEGLLRGLLFEVLRQSPSFIQKLWPSSNRSSRVPRNWTRSSIFDSLNRLVQLDTIPVKFCFFIDGLDEYESAREGDHSELAKILEKLAKSPDIKLCLSSRPWYVFKDAFGKDLKRCLKLEDLTKEDIKRYVHSRFEENPRYRQLESEDSAYTELEADVVKRAQGVFLWVYLVVQSLLRGFTNADQISTLQERLRALPDGLDEYFQHMLDSVEGTYRSQTATAFQTCLLAFNPLSLMTFWYLDDVRNLDVQAKVQPLTAKVIERRLDDMRRRLDGRTKGLLEVRRVARDPHSGSPFLAHEVDFLHRTARDFIGSAGVQRMLQPYMPLPFNPHVNILKALLAQIKAFPKINHSIDSCIFQTLLKGLLSYDRMFQDTIDPPFEELFRILYQVEQVVFERDGQSMKGDRTAFVGLLVQQLHTRYIAWRIKQDPLVVQPLEYMIRWRPLLDYSCDSEVEAFYDLRLDLPSDFNMPAQSEMVRILINAGGDPNLSYEGDTLWLRFIRRVYRNSFGAENETLTSLVEISKLLVGAGADLNQTISVQKKRHKFHAVDVVESKMTAGNVLSKRLAGLEGLEEIFIITKSKQSWWYSWIWPFKPT